MAELAAEVADRPQPLNYCYPMCGFAADVVVEQSDR